MNKNILIIIVLISTFIIPTKAQNKLKVISSCSIFEDMARNIGGDLIELQSIVPIGGDPHLHSPTPRDARIVQGADLILINGLTFEGWIKELIDNSGTKGETVLITKGVTPIVSQIYADSADPHAWMNAENGLIYIKNISDAFIKADPANSDQYTGNYNQYKAKITQAHQDIKAEIAKVPASKRVLITSHDAFSYFGNEYGLQVEPIIGVSTEADVQTSDMIRVAKTIKEKQVPAVFVESTINPKILQQIAKDNDVKIGGELYADSLGEAGSEGATYIGMLVHNAKTIAKGLNMSTTAETLPAEVTEQLEKVNTKGLNFLIYFGIGIAVVLIALFLRKRARNA